MPCVCPWCELSAHSPTMINQHASSNGCLRKTMRSGPTQAHAQRAWPCHQLRTKLARADTRTRSLSRDGSSLFQLPLFPLTTAIYPTCSGVVKVFEPRYLQMMRDIQDATPPDSTPRFGHIMSPLAAPPAMLEDTVSGLPRLGVAVNIKSFDQQPDGSVLVHYEAARRFWLLSMWQESPYYQACVSWYDDLAPASPSEQELTDQYEQELHAALRKISSVQGKLEQTAGAAGAAGAAGGDGRAAAGTALPEAVVRFAPPPPQARAQGRQQARQVYDLGRPHSQDVAMWRMHGSVYDSSSGGGRNLKAGASSDPYQVLREELGKAQRQELFSFAAATMVELGPAQALGLLHSRDTAARLAWTLEAVRPYLQQLSTQLAMQQAIRGPA